MKKATAPGFSPELGDRIAVAIEKAGGVIAVGRALEVSKDTPARWRDGESKISLHHAARLAEVADVDPAWLAFGVPGSAGADPDIARPDTARPDTAALDDFSLVEQAAETVIEIAASLGQDMDPPRLARTIRERAQRLARERASATGIPAGTSLTGNRNRG